MMKQETMWQAVTKRDDSFIGRFVFGVTSTGIYCRPGCPARTPLRKNVVFFDSPNDAEDAGFRACLRCKPQHSTASSHLAEKIKSVCKLIEESIEGAPTLTTLSEAVDLSPAHLQKSFKQIMGISPKQYAEAIRVRRFKRNLREGMPVTDAVYEAGYSSSSRAYEKSNAQLGMTPATYGAGGSGARIAYSVVDTTVGTILVARTRRGVCSIMLGDDQSKLRDELLNEFPKAEIVEEDENCDYVRQIVDHLKGHRASLDLPLDIRATAFQQRVWSLIRSIPYGGTRTYGDLARELGQPTAARAVARACATNPVALAIPCHRVLASNGALSGYRWGKDRKEQLLQNENSAHAAK